MAAVPHAGGDGARGEVRNEARNEAEHALAERIRAAAAARTPLVIQGGGTKAFYGNSCSGELLDARVLNGIVEYEPTELVVTAKCGMALAELEAVLAARGQMLPFEPPHYAPGATIGGAVAAGLAGPRRASYGPSYGGVRDFVLGARLINGRGELLRFGGTVMKNVAGYDVARVLAGSLGTLGLITEVSVKVLPRPVAEQTVRLELKLDAAITRMNEWGGQPLPISGTVWTNDLLYVRLSGARAAVEAARLRLGGELIDAEGAAALWRGIRDQRHIFFTGDDLTTLPLWRLSVPSSAPMPQLPELQLVEWGGALRWLRTDAPAEDVRAYVSQQGGHATLFRGGNAAARAARAFTPLAPPLLAIHQRLKAEFDPAGIFNHGRMYQEL
jgi:glycolate oxidase FAD binding subunit